MRTTHVKVPPGASERARMGVCVEATPPALDAASGFAWDDTVRLRAEGSDTSRDTTTTTDYLSRDEGDRFVGRARCRTSARGSRR